MCSFMEIQLIMTVNVIINFILFLWEKSLFLIYIQIWEHLFVPLQLREETLYYLQK